jgi:hypothetical protein
MLVGTRDDRPTKPDDRDRVVAEALVEGVGA